MSTPQTVKLCIDRCARSKDGRGRWRAERDCHVQLVKAGSGDANAARTAAAARRIGEWLAGQ
jgi:hypothetical protein